MQAPMVGGKNIAPSRLRDSCISFIRDRKSTRLNSSHSQISYAVFCLKKKNTPTSLFLLVQPPMPSTIVSLLIEPRLHCSRISPSRSTPVCTLETLLPHHSDNLRSQLH